VAKSGWRMSMRWAPAVRAIALATVRDNGRCSGFMQGGVTKDLRAVESADALCADWL